MSLIKNYLLTQMNNETFDPGIDNLPGPVDGYDSESMDIAKLEMLTAREQLMEDIDAIVDEFTFDLPIDDIHERSQLAEDLTRVLCDAVCKNFPV